MSSSAALRTFRWIVNGVALPRPYVGSFVNNPVTMEGRGGKWGRREGKNGLESIRELYLNIRTWWLSAVLCETALFVILHFFQLFSFSFYIHKFVGSALARAPTRDISRGTKSVRIPPAGFVFTSAVVLSSTPPTRILPNLPPTETGGASMLRSVVEVGVTRDGCGSASSDSLSQAAPPCPASRKIEI